MNKEWFIFNGTDHSGPFSIEEIENLYKKQSLNAETLVWKEGILEWEPLFKANDFQFLFEKTETPPEDNDEIPVYYRDDEDESEAPPVPHIPSLPKTPSAAITQQSDIDPQLFDDELPPPIPLDAILNPNGKIQSKPKLELKHSKFSKIILIVGFILFATVVSWYALTQRDASIQLKIKGLMPVYMEKLEATALKKSGQFEVTLALSLDSLTLWGSTNYPGDIQTKIELHSVPKRVLGPEEVAVTVKGQFINHLGKFTRMTITRGSKFSPGEYTYHVEGKETHFLNKNFRSLSNLPLFQALNKTYTFDGTTLIYAGTPREFEKKIEDYKSAMLGEMLKPFQDKLERVQTFESILNATSQNYLMELEKIKVGKGISSFENKFIKEISPLLETLVTKALELSKDPKTNEENNTVQIVSPYREQVSLGKQIGEMASDMITKTSAIKKLTDKDKSLLREEFDKRSKSIKVQIDMNIKQLEEQIQKLSR